MPGTVINPDTGAPLIVNDERVLASEFERYGGARSSAMPTTTRKNRRAITALFGRPTVGAFAASRRWSLSGATCRIFFDYGIAVNA